MACEPSEDDLRYYRELSAIQHEIIEILIDDAQTKEDPEFPSESLHKASRLLDELKKLTEENFRRLSPKKLPVAVKV